MRMLDHLESGEVVIKNGYMNKKKPDVNFEKSTIGFPSNKKTWALQESNL